MKDMLNTSNKFTLGKYFVIAIDLMQIFNITKCDFMKSIL